MSAHTPKMGARIRDDYGQSVGKTEKDLLILPPRYDPTQMEEWQRFRNQTIGDSAMLSAQNKVCSDETSRMRSDSDAFRITS